MQVGLIGLGRMGMNMAKRLLEGGHEVIVYNRTPEKVDQITGEGAAGAYSLAELAEKLSPPRIVWIMLPAGSIVDDHIEQLTGLLNRDDIIIEGGNSYYKDDIRHSEALSGHGIQYMDVGVSGGIWGYEIGYCTMAGGEKEVFDYLEPLFKTLAPEGGYLYCGGVGAGHFVKMVHNGIEYGMMQAYGEGFDILENSPYAESLDYSLLSNVWNRGSVIRSWLLELAEKAFKEDPKIEGIKGYVADSGEGRWTVQQAVESGVPAPVIALSLMSRFRSQQSNSFSDRVLAALRKEFGGHEVVTSDDSEQ
ncbi:phosphogluconate dehydrogenase (NAD(+)-dependent, decarboxylating) [Thermodesulfobacteriota bacterium]